ncbi:hypothetical protein OROHE_021947 [Orobanche hederae]
MAARLLMATTSTTTVCFNQTLSFNRSPASLVAAPPALLIRPSLLKFHMILSFKRKKPNVKTVRLAMEEGKSSSWSQLGIQDSENESGEKSENKQIHTVVAARAAERAARKRSERFIYLVAAVMSSLGITSMAVVAVYYRFSWQMEGGNVPYAEMFGTCALSFGAAVSGNGVLGKMGTQSALARFIMAHARGSFRIHLYNQFLKRNDRATPWIIPPNIPVFYRDYTACFIRCSHHRPRDGPFELNDVFAITNAVPAITLLAYGFFHKGLIPGLCFGAGLGITVFGMAYMFVHDGLVHRRFPVGPVANVPYFRRVAAAHQLHHSNKFNGVPYGLFLGPKELEEVGGLEELDIEIGRRIKLSKSL